jgi:outer membrane lipoprotein
MSRFFLLLLLLAAVSSCAPVLRKDLMETGARDVPFPKLVETPEALKGRLFILGGLIVHTKISTEGSLIEALYMPVDARGYLKNGGPHNRFLALYPKDAGILDPLIYRRDRVVTLAGIFAGTRPGRIDEMEYVYPLFEIREIYLWQEAYHYEPYPHWYPSFWYYPYPYWRGFPLWPQPFMSPW